MDRACLMDLNLLRSNNNLDTGSSSSSSPTYNGQSSLSNGLHQSPPNASTTTTTTTANNNNSSINGRLSRTDSYSSEHSNATTSNEQQQYRKVDPNSAAGRKLREFTPDERKDNHYWDRRRRNNEAAKRSREKRRMHDVALEQRLMEVINENMFLRAEIQALRDEYSIPLEAPPLVLQKPALLAAAQAAVNHAQNALQQQYHAATNTSSSSNSNSGNTTPIMPSHHNIMTAAMKPTTVNGSMFAPLLAAHIGGHLTASTGSNNSNFPQPLVQQQQPFAAFTLGGFSNNSAGVPATFAVKNFLLANNNNNNNGNNNILPACTLNSAIIQNNINALAARLASASSVHGNNNHNAPTITSIAPPTIPLTPTTFAAFRTMGSSSDNNNNTCGGMMQRQVFDFQLQQQAAYLHQPTTSLQNIAAAAAGQYAPVRLQAVMSQEGAPLISNNNYNTNVIKLEQNRITGPSSSAESNLTAATSSSSPSSAHGQDDSNDGALSPSTVAVNTLLQFAEGQWGGVPGFAPVRPSPAAKQQTPLDTTKVDRTAQQQHVAAAAATNRDSKSPSNSQNRVKSSAANADEPRTTTTTQWPLKLRHKERNATIRPEVVTVVDAVDTGGSPPNVAEAVEKTATTAVAPVAADNSHKIDDEPQQQGDKLVGVESPPTKSAPTKQRRPSFQCASSKLLQTTTKTHRGVVVKRALDRRDSKTAANNITSSRRVKITKKLAAR